MPAVIGLIYVCVVLGVSVFMVSLCYRFVRAHERMAEDLDLIARKFRNEGKE